jgi:thioredoxin 2
VAVTVACSRCGASNRVDAGRVEQGLQPVCGRCRAPIYPSSAVVETSDGRFDDQVLSSSLPVLLDVWAPWCVPCRGMEPIIEELARSLAGRVRVAKLNVDRAPATASRLRIQGVPTLIVFRHGHEVARMVGARPKAEILRALETTA